MGKRYMTKEEAVLRSKELETQVALFVETLKHFAASEWTEEIDSKQKCIRGGYVSRWTPERLIGLTDDNENQILAALMGNAALIGATDKESAVRVISRNADLILHETCLYGLTQFKSYFIGDRPSVACLRRVHEHEAGYNALYQYGEDNECKENNLQYEADRYISSLIVLWVALYRESAAIGNY